MSFKHNDNERNRVPLTAEIDRELLFLDAYGMTASALADKQPVELSTRIAHQALLPPLIDALAEDGWAYAGAGHFSAVFVKGGLALKLGFKVNDTGAMYAAWCRANQALPGVPIIYAISKFSSCYVVLTRRYDKLGVSDEDEEVSALKYAVNCGKGDRLSPFDTVMTGITIREFFDGVATFDLHKDNLMQDHHGGIVITDPISYGPCSETLYDARYYPTNELETAA